MNIRQYRKQQNLSQRELAIKVGVTQGAVSQWELYNSYPSGRQAARLVELSDGQITLADLYPDPEPEQAAA